MSDLDSTLDVLSRPRLIISAARFGLAEYNRERSLARLLRETATPGPRAALERLLQIEARIEQSRCAGAADYSAVRHVEVMIALMGEARLHRRAARPGPAAIAAE